MEITLEGDHWNRLSKSVYRAFVKTLRRGDEKYWQRLYARASAAGAKARAKAYTFLEASEEGRLCCGVARKTVVWIVKEKFGDSCNEDIYRGSVYAWNILAAFLFACNTRNHGIFQLTIKGVVFYIELLIALFELCRHWLALWCRKLAELKRLFTRLQLCVRIGQ